MTTELEKQFFEKFGIEPDTEIYWCGNDNKLCECEYDCDELCRSRKIGYPQITDRLYLELHCLLNSIDQPPYGQNVEELKKDILISSIGIFGKNETTTFFEEIKHQVQALFEEG